MSNQLKKPYIVGSFCVSSIDNLNKCVEYVLHHIQKYVVNSPCRTISPHTTKRVYRLSSIHLVQNRANLSYIWLLT